MHFDFAYLYCADYQHLFEKNEKPVTLDMKKYYERPRLVAHDYIIEGLLLQGSMVDTVGTVTAVEQEVITHEPGDTFVHN